MSHEFTESELQILHDFLSTPAIDLKEICFPKQLEFVQDTARFATAVTSRRAGKTTACAIHLLKTALENPESTSFYITFARTDAKGIVWPMLHQLNRYYALGGEANEADLVFRFPNHSVIRLGGAATPSEINRFRGYKAILAYVDECQRFPNYLKDLVDDVLSYATGDTLGQIRLIGTPTPVPVGYFHDVCTAPNWSHHRWTMWDNPYLDADAILKDELARRGVTENDPTIRRECFGEFVIDTKRLVLEYNPERNHYDVLPDAKMNYIMGIDLGFHDADAIVVLGYTDSSNTTYLVDEKITEKQGLTGLVEQVGELRKRYPTSKIMIDTGGLGLKLAEEMRRRYAIPVIAAEKQRKFETIEILNDALRLGIFRAKDRSRFASDSMLLEWDMDKLRPDKKAISDRFHSDVIDAALYAFKESPAYSYRLPIALPNPGTPEWAKAEEARMEEATLERLKESQIMTGMEWL